MQESSVIEGEAREGETKGRRVQKFWSHTVNTGI